MSVSKGRTSSVPCRDRDYRNFDMRVAEVRKFYKLDEAGDSLVHQAMSQLNPSAGGHHYMLKLARTIADLAEALLYRPKLIIG